MMIDLRWLLGLWVGESWPIEKRLVLWRRVHRGRRVNFSCMPECCGWLWIWTQVNRRRNKSDADADSEPIGMQPRRWWKRNAGDTIPFYMWCQDTSMGENVTKHEIHWPPWLSPHLQVADVSAPSSLWALGPILIFVVCSFRGPWRSFGSSDVMKWLQWQVVGTLQKW